MSDNLNEQAMLEIKNLNKTYGSRKGSICALKDINFTLSKGDHLAIIGPNGSGKTTLIKILTQISHPSGGEVLIEDKPLSSNDKASFGLMMGKAMIYHRLTVRQNLHYYAELYPSIRKNLSIENLARRYDFEDYLDTFVEDLSEGTQTKVAFARAVMHQPKILVLDEPTNSIDPIAAEKIKNEIKKYKTVIFSSHNLDDVINIANKILILKKGRQVFFGLKKELTSSKNHRQIYQTLIEKL